MAVVPFRIDGIPVVLLAVGDDPSPGSGPGFGVKLVWALHPLDSGRPLETDRLGGRFVTPPERVRGARSSVRPGGRDRASPSGRPGV